MCVIRVDDLSKKYGEKIVLQNVNFQIPRGETVAVVGPNGTGKTTLLEILMTLRKCDSGTVEILGHSLKEQKNVDAIRASFYDVGNEKIRNLIEFFELEPYLNTKYAKLSSGWKQRFLLAIAFLHDPDLLFLDEPTTGLDPKATQLVWKKIKSGNENKTILVSTHSMEEVDKFCDRVIVLNRGGIIANDSPANIKNQLGVSFFTEAYFMLIKEES